MKNLSLNQKISIVIAVFIVGLMAISALGIMNLGTLNDSLVTITTKNSPRIVNSTSVRAQFRNNAILLLNVAIETNPAELARASERLNDAHADQLKLLERVMSEASAEARPKYERVQSLYHQWWEHAQKLREAKLKGQAFLDIYAGNKRVRGEAEAILRELVDFNLKMMDDATRDAAQLYATSRNLTLALGALITLIASAIAFMVLSATARKINAIILSLREGSAQVSSAAQQIASASEELSQASTEQAASLEETAASIEEMNSMIAKSSDNASDAAKASSHSRDSVAEGKNVVQRMIESMDSIHHNSERMSEIIKIIEDIGAKTKVINDIVFQTKLLSFNASVEAARAGEHGKGFAVVAEEVGNLAQMSGNAAHEISSLLQDSTQKVQQIILETKTNVASGSQVARQCGEAFDSVVGNVEKVAKMMDEISAACGEQSRGSAELSRAMTQVDQATQQNAATSEECASASEELAAQAETLEGTVGDLALTILGGNSAQPARNPPHQPSRAKPADSNNLVHLSSVKPKAGAKVRPLARAAGDAPAYDHPEFEDV